MVNVGLPALAGDLHADPARLSWTINAYLLPLGALILLGGGLGDHFGRRGVFLTGLSIFLAASINSAVARIAGLLATALLTFVFARSGSSEDFTSAFHAAAWIGAASSGIAAACGYGLLAEPTRPAR